MSWDKFESFGENLTAKISIRRTGHIGFSFGAVNRFDLKDFGHCELHYNSDDEMIGFRFTNEEKAGSTTKLVQRGLDCFISAKPFLHYYNIECKPTKSYLGMRDEETGLVVIDLKRPYLIHGEGRKSAEKKGDATMNEE